MGGGSSHERAKERKAKERLANQVTEEVVQKLKKDLSPGVKPDEKQVPTTLQKVGIFLSSTPVWGVIGMFVAVFISRISVRLVYILSWFVLFGVFLRVKFFARRTFWWNTSAALLIGLALFALWKITPPPKETPTIDQALDEFANKFPWIKAPPKVEAQQSPPIIATSSWPRLKVSVTDGQGIDRTLILDNRAGDSDVTNFQIDGLVYYLDAQGAANRHAKIANRCVIPGPLNFKPFSIKAHDIKRIDLSKERYAIGILACDGADNILPVFDSIRHFVCVHLVFTLDSTGERFVHYEVISRYGDLFQLVEHPEHSAGGVIGRPDEEGWPYSIIHIVKENAREYYGMEHREYQP